MPDTPLTVAQAREVALRRIYGANNEFDGTVPRQSMPKYCKEIEGTLNALIAAVRADERAQRPRVSDEAVAWLRDFTFWECPCVDGDGNDRMPSATELNEHLYAAEILAALGAAPPESARGCATKVEP